MKSILVQGKNQYDFINIFIVMAIFDITFKLIVALEFCLYFEESFTTGSGSLKKKEICVVNSEDPEQ